MVIIVFQRGGILYPPAKPISFFHPPMPLFSDWELFQLIKFLKALKAKVRLVSKNLNLNHSVGRKSEKLIRLKMLSIMP